MGILGNWIIMVYTIVITLFNGMAESRINTNGNVINQFDIELVNKILKGSVDLKPEFLKLGVGM